MKSWTSGHKVSFLWKMFEFSHFRRDLTMTCHFMYNVRLTSYKMTHRSFTKKKGKSLRSRRRPQECGQQNGAAPNSCLPPVPRTSMPAFFFPPFLSEYTWSTYMCINICILRITIAGAIPSSIQQLFLYMAYLYLYLKNGCIR